MVSLSSPLRAALLQFSDLLKIQGIKESIAFEACGILSSLTRLNVPYYFFQQLRKAYQAKKFKLYQPVFHCDPLYYTVPSDLFFLTGDPDTCAFCPQEILRFALAMAEGADYQGLQKPNPEGKGHFDFSRPDWYHGKFTYTELSVRARRTCLFCQQKAQWEWKTGKEKQALCDSCKKDGVDNFFALLKWACS